MKLSNLHKYNDIVIQLHDNPDADAIGSGYAVYKYFEKLGKKVRMVYGGSFKITKSNMVILIDTLKIPVEFVTELDNPELLITVDCQYGEGNVTHFEAQNIAMIDHHNTGRESSDMCEIRSYIVSCSTVVYDMLRKEGVDVNEDKGVATALYYGLYMDSNGLSELRHPLERDMLDDLYTDKGLVMRLINSNFSINEMETAGMALLRYNYDEYKRVSIIKAKECDPNILGVIGDFLLQVDTIDVCVVYNECPGGYKISIRSCVIEVAANDLAQFLTEGIGNGGGHIGKAGGFISKKQFDAKYNGLGIEFYFPKRVAEYYESYDAIYSYEGIKDHSEFSLFEKKSVVCGYVKLTDVIPEGVEFKLRTYEGDAFLISKPDIYVMIGTRNEVYPIEKEVFDRKYTSTNEPFGEHLDYVPTIRDLNSNKAYDLDGHFKQCISTDHSKVYAKCLTKPAKVFTKWNYEKYMVGEVGDYLCYMEEDEKDAYIVKADVFDNIYARIKED